MITRCLSWLRGSWRALFLGRPHLRFDGIYVSRNTYIRTGGLFYLISRLL